MQCRPLQEYITCLNKHTSSKNMLAKWVSSHYDSWYITHPRYTEHNSITSVPVSNTDGMYSLMRTVTKRVSLTGWSKGLWVSVYGSVGNSWFTCEGSIFIAVLMFECVRHRLGDWAPCQGCWFKSERAQDGFYKWIYPISSVTLLNKIWVHLFFYALV